MQQHHRCSVAATPGQSDWTYHFVHLRSFIVTSEKPFGAAAAAVGDTIGLQCSSAGGATRVWCQHGELVACDDTRHHRLWGCLQALGKHAQDAGVTGGLQCAVLSRKPCIPEARELRGAGVGRQQAHHIHTYTHFLSLSLPLSFLVVCT